VLQVLHQLPEGLAIAVLAAAPISLECQLAILPASLHPLAVEAAFPSIFHDHFLTLDCERMTSLFTSQTVLHVAIRAANTLRHVDLKNIPKHEDTLLQQVAGLCTSASDVKLRHQFQAACKCLAA
jgi:hypothetical protein